MNKSIPTTPDPVKVAREAIAQAYDAQFPDIAAELRRDVRLPDDFQLKVDIAAAGARAMAEALAAKLSGGASFDALQAAYLRGAEWHRQYGDDPLLAKAAYDYADKATSPAPAVNANDTRLFDLAWNMVCAIRGGGTLPLQTPAAAADEAAPYLMGILAAHQCTTTPVADHETAPVIDKGDLVERLAQWLHDEVEYPDPNFPHHHWPEHPDDTGQRQGGWLKIIPKDTQEQFRDIARRLATFMDRTSAAEITRLRANYAELERHRLVFRRERNLAEDRALAAEAERDALRAEVARKDAALHRAELWLQARVDGRAIGGTTSERLADARAALSAKEGAGDV